MKTHVRLLVFAVLCAGLTYLAMSYLGERPDVSESARAISDARMPDNGAPSTGTALVVGAGAGSGSDPGNAPAARGYAEDELYGSVLSERRSVYPSTPLAVYEANIAAADSGDAASLFKIAKVIELCEIGPHSEQELEELAHEPILLGYLDDYKAHMAQCNPLRVRLSERAAATGVAQKSHDWVRKAADAGSRIAVADLLMDFNLYERAGPVLKEAVSKDGHAAYYLTADYLVRMGLVETPHAAAWRIAACRAHQGCNHELLEGFLPEILFEHDVETVLELSREILSGNAVEVFSETEQMIEAGEGKRKDHSTPYYRNVPG